MPLRAIFYDAGFTLIEPSRSFAAICAEALQRRGHPAEAAMVEAHIPPFDPFFHERQRHTDAIFASDALLDELWHAYYRHVFTSVSAPHQFALSEEELHACATEVVALYSRADHWRPFADVIPTLEEGRRRGLIQGVISDWGSQLTTILHDLGLTRYLDFVVVSATVGAAKPNGHLFDLALRRAAVARDDVIYVGDTYQADIVGARGAGITAILLDRDGAAPLVDCPVIGSLAEIFAHAPATSQRPA
ncbi:MAG: HAD family hydrolase [Dehalococcoidia bacterium]|nr:HAD family hydrolase [Dehalococcoidia bacterium]